MTIQKALRAVGGKKYCPTCGKQWPEKAELAPPEHDFPNIVVRCETCQRPSIKMPIPRWQTQGTA